MGCTRPVWVSVVYQVVTFKVIGLSIVMVVMIGPR